MKPITISKKKLFGVLIIIAFLLCLVSITLKATEWRVGTNNTYLLYQTALAFNVNREGNIPTWYSSLLLSSVAVVGFIITYAKFQSKARYCFHWGGIALLFLYLSIDEAAALHERLTTPIQESLNVTDYLYFGWVVVGIPVVIVLGVTYLRFILHLPKRTRNLFLLSALSYIGGALVVESISARVWYENDGTSLLYSSIGTFEEFLEMFGVILFLYSLLDYIENQFGKLQIGMLHQAESTEG